MWACVVQTVLVSGSRGPYVDLLATLTFPYQKSWLCFLLSVDLLKTIVTARLS